MVENRIEVHEMVSSTESLESLFFSLTGGEPAAGGQAAAPMGDYRRFNEGPLPSPRRPPCLHRPRCLRRLGQSERQQ